MIHALNLKLKYWKIIKTRLISIESQHKKKCFVVGVGVSVVGVGVAKVVVVVVVCVVVLLFLFLLLLILLLLLTSFLLLLLLFLLSKPNVTQLNSTQLKATQKQLRWVRPSTHVFPTPPPPQTFQALLD